MDTPILQVYGQGAFHDDVWIVGNDKSMWLLLNALNKALSKGKATTDSDVFCSDGEGYSVHVKILPTEAGIWNKLAVPYTEDYAQGGVGVHPEVAFNESSEKLEMKKTYDLYATCRNCGATMRYEIPFGVTKNDFFSNKLCDFCGCFINDSVVLESYASFYPKYSGPYNSTTSL